MKARLERVLQPLKTRVDTAVNVCKSTGKVAARSATGVKKAAKAATVGAVQIAADSVRKRWLFAILLTLVVIHVTRMGLEATPWDLLAPCFATLADFVAACLFGWAVLRFYFLLIAAFNRLSAPRRSNIQKKEQAGKALSRVDSLCKTGIWAADLAHEQVHKLGSQLFETTALQNNRRGKASLAIQIGLFPMLAVVAISPVWGFTWYFNTENWGTGIQHVWAGIRTDCWRHAYVKAATSYHSGRHPRQPEAVFAVDPPGLEGESFSFIVIGDPGEGDASQFALHDQLLGVAQDPDVKFILVSSDVIYPSGGMKDYEKNFYLPFKGIKQPIYAMPGNHDWYSKLEAFMANFYEPEYVQAVFQQTGSKWWKAFIGLLTEVKIDRLGGYIKGAQELRSLYHIQNGRQKNMYFRISTDHFLLLVVDTGTKRRVDSEQFQWMKNELEQAGSKVKMALLGHPLFVHGKYSADGDRDFNTIYELLKQYEVDIVMAGDVHDFEYYAVKYGSPKGDKVMHHFVNGGGGASLDLETALAWPKNPDSQIFDFAFFPRTDAVRQKLDKETPWWKWPLLWWTTQLGAWPFSPGTTSSAFDFNVAPFYQSFVKVTVNSQGTPPKVVITPYSTNGPLQISTIARSDVGGPGSAMDTSYGAVKFNIQ